MLRDSESASGSRGTGGATADADNQPQGGELSLSAAEREHGIKLLLHTDYSIVEAFGQGEHDHVQPHTQTCRAACSRRPRCVADGRAAVTSRIYPDTALLPSGERAPWAASLFVEGVCEGSEPRGLSVTAEAEGWELGSCWVDPPE